MRILIANDDGVYSPGIAAAARAASKFGEVRIVAPDVEQSSMGHAITATRPLSYRKTVLPGADKFDAYRVNGTPADCVAMGTHHWEKVDLVLSGVNLGLNLGNSMWHSGTLAAAKQAALLNIRAVALSAPVTKDEPDFTKLQPFIEAAIEQLLPEKELPLVNVNFPENPKGVRWTRQSVRHYDGKVVAAKDPMDRPVFWFTVVSLEAAEEGTDRWAVENGYVSMTPLRLDLTDQAALAKVLARKTG
jgi:5'-nucleotidase